MALYLAPYIPPEADQKPPNSMMLPHAIVVLASDYYFQRNVIYQYSTKPGILRDRNF